MPKAKSKNPGLDREPPGDEAIGRWARTELADALRDLLWALEASHSYTVELRAALMVTWAFLDHPELRDQPGRLTKNMERWLVGSPGLGLVYRKDTGTHKAGEPDMRAIRRVASMASGDKTPGAPNRRAK